MKAKFLFAIWRKSGRGVAVGRVVAVVALRGEGGHTILGGIAKGGVVVARDCVGIMMGSYGGAYGLLGC